MDRPPGAYRKVAQLHIDCIDQGFLPQLGPAFLTLMYECIDRDPDSILITCERDGEVVGFVTASAGLSGVYRRMLLRPWRLGLALIPSLVRPRRVLRILEILRYSGAQADAAGLPATELLSLAVAPAWRGKGCADALYRDLVEALGRRGVDAFKIVVGAPLAPAHRFYRRMGAVPAREIEVHRGETSTVYVHPQTAGPSRRSRLDPACA